MAITPGASRCVALLCPSCACPSPLQLLGRTHGPRLPRLVLPSAHEARRMTRFAFFYQSVISDWNHGNAHFLRGLMRALQARGHRTVCFERTDNWSLRNLLRIRPGAIEDFVARFPDLGFERYSFDANLDAW